MPEYSLAQYIAHDQDPDTSVTLHLVRRVLWKGGNKQELIAQIKNELVTRLLS